MADGYAAQVVYTVPHMDRVRVRKDVVFQRDGDLDLKADLYYPPDDDGFPLPAVIFVHGEGRPEMMGRAKDWGQYVSWGRLVAAFGLVGITFTHRSVAGLTNLAEAAHDVQSLIRYIREHAADLGIDASRLCIWTCSAGGPVGLYAALDEHADFVRCIVSYYAFMDLQHLDGWLGRPIPPEVTDEQRRAFSPLYRMRANPSIPPMLVVRAGRDQVPQLNQSIDRFVAAALDRNLPLWLVNAPEAPHAFELFETADWSREIVRQTLAFIQTHLGATK